jgi:hypothetical protein
MRTCLAPLLVGACTIGAPPGFSSGNTWTLPLVDPLAKGSLVTPVYIGGNGPYLFAIEPDAPISFVDMEIATQFGIRAGRERRPFYGNVLGQLAGFRVGDLTISLVDIAVVSGHAFDANGRRIHGVLGRNVIADSLVLGYDRDRGIAWLKTQEVFHPPATARVVEYEDSGHALTRGRKWDVPRRIISSTVDGVDVGLHADFGRATSQLDPEFWTRAKLQPHGADLTIVDENGSSRTVSRLGSALRVIAGGVMRVNLEFAPLERHDSDGTLGLDFFAPFVVEVDWQHSRIYLTPRSGGPGVRETRISRWGTRLPRCKSLGCVRLGLERATLTVTPDLVAANFDLDVTVQAISSFGEPLPQLEINVPKGVGPFEAPLDAKYIGATLEVLDVSPFPRRCPASGGCVIVDS